MTLSQHHREILQALLDGKTVQLGFPPNMEYSDVGISAVLNTIATAIDATTFGHMRIKPEPERRLCSIARDGFIYNYSINEPPSIKPTHWIDILDGDIVGYGKISDLK